MCGIIAVINSSQSEKFALACLEKITHRGGNTFELKTFGNVTIGANRLPIVGRTTGRQPLANGDKTIFAVQNGEIFNHKKLRSELELKGYKFKSESDTEVLAHLYQEYGAHMVDHLDSEMYAFVIYDLKRDMIFAARDPLGVKPLYYAVSKDHETFFASELKQLVDIEGVEIIEEFPKGHYYLDGDFTKYFDIKEAKLKLTEEQAALELQEVLVESVRKRVDTDLPIGVFLSGGVDSSLIMELATRFHPDVTAIILGTPGSSDYDFAVKLCKERNYKYQVVNTEIDFKEELKELIYYVETYEPLIIRQSFANWIVSREAQRLGLSVVLVGEGADELFAGYNEFSALSSSAINKGCKTLTENLGAGHLKRVDRSAMRFTVEVRSPFLDSEVIKTAFRIPGDLKIKKDNHRVTTKYIFRKVAEKFLPNYIAWRYKVPFANGAGMNVGYNYKTEDGALSKIARAEDIQLDKDIEKKYKLETSEEKLYFKMFNEFKYTKLNMAHERIVVKDVLNQLNPSKRHRIVLAEFDKLALYFPVYLANQKKLFALHGLDVDFIATGGDDKTYATLLNNSAQVGIADPLFAMFDETVNPNGVGEIIGELVGLTPVCAVTINPGIIISKPQDLASYRVGTFQKFTTTHTFLTSLNLTIFPQEFEYSEVIQRMINREIDIAVVLLEQALELEKFGGRIVYDFSQIKSPYLFSGFTIAATLDSSHRKKLPAFLAAIKESLLFIHHNEKEALKIFRRIFPELQNHEYILSTYKRLWTKSLKVNHDGYLQSHKSWTKVHPGITKKAGETYFRSRTHVDELLDVINHSSIRREYPFLEDKLRVALEKNLKDRTPLLMYGFWGAGPKSHADDHDRATVQYFKKYVEKIHAQHQPGVKAVFILADLHGENNGYPKEKIQSYLQGVQKLLTDEGFDFVYLSELWSKWGITLEDVATILENKKAGWWDAVSISAQLESRSENNYKGGDALLGAQRYYLVREIESAFLPKEYPNSIFFVFGDSLAQQIYPKQPTVYLYTEKKYFSTCPWFNLE